MIRGPVTGRRTAAVSGTPLLLIAAAVAVLLLLAAPAAEAQTPPGPPPTKQSEFAGAALLGTTSLWPRLGATQLCTPARFPPPAPSLPPSD